MLGSLSRSGGREGESGVIDKHFGDYILVCDYCEEEAEECWDTFQDAVDGKRKLGWKSKRIGNGRWKDICPNCANED